MNRKEFFKMIEGIVKPEEMNRIWVAYWLAKATHEGVKRDNGERYFDHCRRTACILIDFGNPTANEIAIGLLHDSVEDGFIPFDVMRMLFGDYITEAVNTLSKFTIFFDEDTGFVKEKKKKNPAEYFNAIMKADRTVRRVKLADRLDNLHDMNVWPEDRQKKYVAKTKKYILPIARLTDEKLAEEIEKTLRLFAKKS